MLLELVIIELCQLNLDLTSILHIVCYLKFLNSLRELISPDSLLWFSLPKNRLNIRIVYHLLERNVKCIIWTLNIHPTGNYVDFLYVLIYSIFLWSYDIYNILVINILYEAELINRKNLCWFLCLLRNLRWLSFFRSMLTLYNLFDDLRVLGIFLFLFFEFDYSRRN